MNVINWEDFIKDGLNHDKKTSMTVGIFDGVHLGHQALLRKLVLHNKDFTPVVVTFRDNHKTIKMRNGECETQNAQLKQCAQLTQCAENSGRKDIQNFQQRLEMFESFGIQTVIVIDFCDEFRQIPGSRFLEILFEHGNIGYFAVGGNFRCGCQLDTDAAAVMNFFTLRNITAEIMPEVTEGAYPVSSSRIRSAIAEGNIPLAEKMLGRKYL